MIERVIPSTGESIGVVGLGTWKRFDLDPAGDLAAQTDVLKELNACGGSMIDASPMYGQAEEVVGEATMASAIPDKFFYATKVWTTSRQQGIKQMDESFRKMKREVIDLMQIHNLVDWKTHLKTLKEYKEAGRIRYIGITHYTDEMHEELEKIINNEAIDFVQFNYSISSRNAEKRLLPACADRGVATIINKPFGSGDLFEKVKIAKLPEWCEEQGISYWSQFFLKYIIGHPAVTCVIPATADKDHMRNNADAGNTPIPDQHMLNKMAEFIDNMK